MLVHQGYGDIINREFGRLVPIDWNVHLALSFCRRSNGHIHDREAVARIVNRCKEPCSDNRLAGREACICHDVINRVINNALLDQFGVVAWEDCRIGDTDGDIHENGNHCRTHEPDVVRLVLSVPQSHKGVAVTLDRYRHAQEHGVGNVLWFSANYYR